MPVQRSDLDTSAPWYLRVRTNVNRLDDLGWRMQWRQDIESMDIIEKMTNPIYFHVDFHYLLNYRQLRNKLALRYKKHNILIFK